MKKGYLRLANSQWYVVIVGGESRPFLNLDRAIQFCNKNKVAIRNKTIIENKFRIQLKY